MIVNAVTSFLGTLVEQVMKPVREFLADTLLATPDVTRHADIKRLWRGTLGITAGIYVLFVTAGGVTVMGYETVQTRYTLRQIVPRLLLGMVAATASLAVMGKAIGLSNALAHAIMATGLPDAGQGMVERVVPFALFGAPGVKLYLLLLALVMIALVIAVLIGFLVRVAVMALLAVAAPLMLACHAHPLTDPVARLWWRALAGCLVIQVAQSMTFVLALKLFFAPGATTLGIPRSDQLGTTLAGVALFWVLFKIPGWTLQVVLRGTPVHNPHAPTGVRVLKHLAMYRLMDHYLPGMSLLRQRPAGSRGGGGFGGGLGGTGGPGGRSGGGGGGHQPSAPAAGPPLRAGPARRPGRGASPGAGSNGGAGGAPVAGPAPVASAASGGSGAGAANAHLALTASGPPGTSGAVLGQPAGPVPRAQSPNPAGPAVAGPRAVMIRPARSRRIRQPPRTAPDPRAVSRPSQPTPHTAQPVRAGRAPAPPAPPVPSRATTPSPSPTARPTAAPRARQLVLHIPARRVRVRPPRPMQLRLPLEPPRR